MGRPANFYTEGGAQVLTGSLLGQPASVRFTPVAWRWDFGDGHSKTTSTGGKRWREGKEFFDGPTTHRYEEKADYVATLFVDFAAEYQFAGRPWAPIQGVLPVRSNDMPILTWNVSTRVVSRDCIDDPDGIGCEPTR